MIYPCHYPDTLFHINGLHTAFNKHWDSAFDFHGESHDFWEIVTVISGEVEIVEDGKVYILGPSQMICHRPPHQKCRRDQSKCMDHQLDS